MTPEMCLTAVQQYGWTIQYVPEELRTPELCLVAITQDPDTLKYSPFSVLELMSHV